jgi:superfamily II DNA/RNA helicase
MHKVLNELFGDKWGSELPSQPGSLSSLQQSIKDDPFFEAIRTGDGEMLSDACSPKYDRLVKYLAEDVFALDDKTGAPADGVKVIIFCTTRHATQVVCKQLMKEENLVDRGIRADVIVGHGGKKSSRKLVEPGMTHTQQRDVAAQFRSGNINVLVATSVVEEGLDVSSCQFVIRYDSATTTTAMIQSRGRARAKDGRYVIFVASKQDIDDNNKLLAQEMEMHEAISLLRGERHKDVKSALELQSKSGARRFWPDDATSVLTDYISSKIGATEDSSTPTELQYRQLASQAGGSGKHRATLINLPNGIGLPAEIHGRDASSEKKAKTDVALLACILLHNSGRLVGFLGNNWLCHELSKKQRSSQAWEQSENYVGLGEYVGGRKIMRSVYTDSFSFTSSA